MTSRPRSIPKYSVPKETCADCMVEFKSKAALEAHTCVLKYDPALEVEIDTRSEEDIKAVDVVLTDSNKAAYKCLKCTKTFKTLKGCNVHVSHCRATASTISDIEDSPQKLPMPIASSVRKIRHRVKQLNPSTSDSDCKNSTGARSRFMKRKDKQYVCSRCPQICTSMNEYRRHIKSHKSGASTSTVILKSQTTSTLLSTEIVDGRHQCPNCQQKFRKIGSYRRHLRSHLNIHAYQCKHCMISYLKKSQLVVHVQKIHLSEKPYACSLCDKKFLHSIGFRKHKSEHLNTPPYQCFRCDAVFPSIAKQMIHITNHAVACSFCRKPFANEEELWLHTSAEHEEDKEDCDFESEASDCGDSDSNDESNANFNEVDVESDADSYTSVELDPEEAFPKRISIYSPKRGKIKGHVCFICERRFPKQRSLDLHMKSHKIHSCMACPKFFAHSSELKAHQQEHLQNNSFFYSKAFNDLQLSFQQQPPPVLNVVPVSTAKTQGTSNGSVSSLGSTPQSSTTDFIAWYSGFKETSKFLKYPIGFELYQSINQIVADLGSTLYSQGNVSQETRDSYIKIYNELTGIIAKNAEHMFI